MGWRYRLAQLTRRLHPGPTFATSDVVIGRHARFGRNVTFNCRRVRIGDCAVFHDDVTVNADVFEIGDYATIYSNCFFPGPGEVRIGHNFWLGKGSTVDGMAGTTIADNVGIGAQSQLWTHMIFGDVMAGCRFHSTKPLVIDADAWLVGHCLVSPVHIGERSIVMLGSVVTRDVPPDRVFAGTPAKDMTETFGPPFAETSPTQRREYLEGRLREFCARRAIAEPSSVAVVVESFDDLPAADGSATVFNVSSRSYVKRATLLERDLLRFLLPEAKFVPESR